MIIIDIHGSEAVIRRQQPLTCGTVGKQVQFRTDETWQDLAATAVFRCGEVTRDSLVTGGIAVIPYEVLTTPGQPLQIGLYGSNEAGTLVIPTVWALTAPLLPGADPSGDPGVEPENPFWRQAMLHLSALATQVADMEALVGDVEQALDEILEIQAGLLGGDAQ